MSKRDVSLELPTELSFKALLGLEEPVGIDGDIVRNIQAKGMRNRTTLRVALNLLLAIFAVSLYRGIAPVWASVLWVAGFAAFHVYSFRAFSSSSSYWPARRYWRVISSAALPWPDFANSTTSSARMDGACASMALARFR